MPTTKSIINESCVETDTAFESLDYVSLDANHVNNRIHHCKGRTHCCANNLMKYIGAYLGTRDITVCQDKAGKNQNKFFELILKVAFSFHEPF
jgi:hypothetical protein